MANNNDLIKVHVTQEQREMLEHLVCRRLGDLIYKRERAPRLGLRCGTPTPEENLLAALKTELQQAGT